MRRWVPILLLAFFCVFLLVRSVQSESELRLVEAFHTLHVTPEQYVLHYGSKLDSMDQQGVVTFLQPFQSYFHLPITVKKEKGEGTVYQSSGKFHSFDVKLTTLCGEGVNKIEPYLSIQITGKGAFDKELLNIKKQLAQLLRINKREPHFHFSIQGHQQTINQEKTMQDALRVLDAKEVESMRAKTVSVSAYSSLLEEEVKTARGEMNVQIATRVDEEKKELIVTMGTPIITIEY